MKPEYQGSEFIYANWCDGSEKRTSGWTDEVFLTRKDRRMSDRKFLNQDRPRSRRPSRSRPPYPLTNGGYASEITRRAKGTKQRDDHS